MNDNRGRLFSAECAANLSAGTGLCNNRMGSKPPFIAFRILTPRLYANHASNANLWVSYFPHAFVSVSIPSLNLSSYPPLPRILLRLQIIILPNLARFIPQSLKLSVLFYSPNALPQSFVPFTILLNPLLNLSLI